MESKPNPFLVASLMNGGDQTLLHLTLAARPKLSQLRRLGEVTRGEALAEVPEADTECLLKTLQTLKANLTDACDSSVAGQKRANHG